MDPVSGWAEIRPYNADTWKFLRAAFKSPLFLLSATMEEGSLDRILGTCEIKRQDLALLYKNSDRPNIYSQRRLLKKPVDVM